MREAAHQKSSAFHNVKRRAFESGKPVNQVSLDVGVRIGLRCRRGVSSSVAGAFNRSCFSRSGFDNRSCTTASGARSRCCSCTARSRCGFAANRSGLAANRFRFAASGFRSTAATTSLDLGDQAAEQLRTAASAASRFRSTARRCGLTANRCGFANRCGCGFAANRFRFAANGLGSAAIACVTRLQLGEQSAAACRLLGVQLREQSTTAVTGVSRRFIHGESRTHQKCERGDPADHIPIHCFLPSVSEFLVRSSSHTSLIQKPSPGSPVGSSIGDHHRNFRTRKIGALRNFCGPRDFVDKVTFAQGLSITGRGERDQKSWPCGLTRPVAPIEIAEPQKCRKCRENANISRLFLC